jgi:SAM-dependent methyltransferase
VTGLDFSGEAIKVARALAAELSLTDRARFVQEDVYAAPDAIAEPAAFDRVFVTWGALNWLPDIARWAKVVAYFLKPGGSLYLAEFHPIASVFDTETTPKTGMPNWSHPYFEHGAIVDTTPHTYTGDASLLRNGPTYEWRHSLGEIVTALATAGLRLKWLHEHDATPWSPIQSVLLRGNDGLWRWPDEPWLPLSFSLWAEKYSGIQS